MRVNCKLKFFKKNVFLLLIKVCVFNYMNLKHLNLHGSSIMLNSVISRYMARQDFVCKWKFECSKIGFGAALIRICISAEQIK